MNNIMSEKECQSFIIERLKEDNGYIVRSADNFDRLFAVDREMLFTFLNKTQPKIVEALKKSFKENFETTLINYLNNEITNKKSSLLSVLKHGVEIGSEHLTLMYDRPSTSYNADTVRLYQENIFSVMEEVYASDNERIDLVIFLNGFAIFTFELKCNFAGQNYEDAIYQYRHDRNPKDRLFLFKAGSLVNFAMDLEEVHMTTKLDGESTYFLPFNMGRGSGVDTGAGNPIYEDKFSVCYMWEDILKKDTVIDFISNFMFIEKKEKKLDDGKIKETVIFPRYHQLDVIRKILADVLENGTTKNYLIQHSAGSGKTNSIAWLAHRLAYFHDNENKLIFDNIVIMTDRIVVDRQLQKAISSIEHKSGLIRVMDESCTSADLKKALQSNTRIVVTTIQKFPYIVDDVKNLSEKKFAVIIDEAHSSTSGRDMRAVNQSLGSETEIDEDAEDAIARETRRIRYEIKKSHKQSNVSIFAFTATPKATTIQDFGSINAKGQREAFHLYSMKQAIEEGFILDVLQNYVTYESLYTINKTILDDPKYKTAEAKRKITRYALLHETNISQRIEVIIEHFRSSVMNELGGNAKAMVIADSRAGAVKYFNAFNKYIKEHEYTDIKALVAFSGKIGDESESTLNGFPEKRTAEEFDKDEYKVLLVANKFQTGFDQPRLCSLYILKKLSGVNAVQTLSRLNRICPPYDKKTFILDFVNDYDEIEKAFSKYYTTTILAHSVKPEKIYELEIKIDAYGILDPDDIEKTSKILYSENPTPAEKKKIRQYIQKAKARFDNYSAENQKELVIVLKHFVRFYEFILQVSCFEDIELHKKYLFITYFLTFINIRHSGGGFTLEDKINASNFAQRKTGEHTKSEIVSNPVIRLAEADDENLPKPKEEKLSKIIADINSRTGRIYDSDVVAKSMLQIRDILKKSEVLKKSAEVNSLKEFEFSYYDNIDDALIEGLEQNKDFFGLLLQNEDIKKEVLGIFAEEIYNSLKEKE